MDNGQWPSGRQILNSQFSIKEYRTPGDIDIWLQGSREEVLDYVRRHVPDCKPVYHHVDFPVIEGLDIEVHFTPSWMNSPVTNRRLQRFFRGERNSNFEVRSSAYSELPIFKSQTVPLFIEGRAEQSEAEGVTSVARRQSYSEIISESRLQPRIHPRTYLSSSVW